MKSRILKVAIPFSIVLGGVAAFGVLLKTRPVPEKAAARQEGVLVETMPVATTSQAVQLPGKGTVAPAQVVALQPEVTGRVVWHSPNLVPGGRFKKGELLLRVDPRDYQIAVEQQASVVDRAKLDVQTEQSRKLVAEREWELLSKNKNLAPARPQDEETSLALRGPQLRTAKASLHAATQGLERAQLGLERTLIRAPWNGMVKDEQVDVGQMVSPQQPVGTLLGTDEFWVQVSVPLDWLVWLTDAQGQIKQVPAKVWTELGGRRLERQGRVVRLLGDVDPVGRMARVLVAIEDPLGLKSQKEVTNRPARLAQKPRDGKEPTAAEAPTLPLLVGTYVNVDIEASELGEVIAIPNRALRDGDNVHVATPQNTLEIRPVKVVFRTDEEVYVSGGLQPGERVVLSRLAAPVPGMLLRTNSSVEPLTKDQAAPNKQATP